MDTQKLVSYAPSSIRLIAGISFIMHGIPKLLSIDKTYGLFGTLSLPLELALPVALLEVIGGFALLFGILPRIASIFFIIEMIGSHFLLKFQRGM